MSVFGTKQRWNINDTSDIWVCGDSLVCDSATKALIIASLIGFLSGVNKLIVAKSHDEYLNVEYWVTPSFRKDI